MAIKILLDYGHGQGSAHNRGYKGAKWKNEGDGNFYFGKMLKAELEKKGIVVGEARPRIGDNPSLSARGNSAKGYDLFMSLHTNAGGGTGVEIYEDVNSRIPALSSALCTTISSTLGIANRGVKHKYNGSSNWYGVLYSNKAKAGMLVEHCFHDSQSDVNKYEAKAETLASNMAKTIANYYGITKGGITVEEKPVRNPEFLEGDVDVKAKETFVIACDRDKMPWIGELIKTGYDRSNGAYSNVVVLQNKKSSVAEYKDCPYRVAVCNTAKEISGYCNYAIIGTEKEIKDGIFRFANGENKAFEADNFR